MDILRELGINPATVRWQDLAACKNVVQVYTDDNGERRVMDPLFDAYENDEPPYPVRNATDQMCLSCPVQPQCYEYGKTQGETGVYGGVYLVNGKPDRIKNEHKTPATYAAVRAKVGKL
jgi:hypothetical protein